MHPQIQYVSQTSQNEVCNLETQYVKYSFEKEQPSIGKWNMKVKYPQTERNRTLQKQGIRNKIRIWKAIQPNISKWHHNYPQTNIAIHYKTGRKSCARYITKCNTYKRHPQTHYKSLTFTTLQVNQISREILWKQKKHINSIKI